MALSRKPLNPEDQPNKNNPVPAQDDVKQSGDTTSPNPSVNPSVNGSQPFTPPNKEQPLSFRPQERRILNINEGVNTNLSDSHTQEEIVEEVKPKRVRLTIGQLTANDVLTKDYETHYARMTPKVMEVTQWAQKMLSDNDKNDDIFRARHDRKEFYEEMATFIDNMLVKYFASSGIVSPRDQGYVVQSVINEVLGLGPLEPLWQDPRISEIMVNGPYDVRVEIRGQVELAPGCQFRDSEHLLQVCQQLLGDIGRRVDIQKPLADGSLPDGSRINVVHPIIAPGGPFLTIRRFPDTIFTIKELIEKQSMTEEMAVFMGNLIYKGCSTLISGGTGSGKTSMLNALSGAIPFKDRVITIEDTLELRLNPKKHVLPMQSKEAAANGEGAVDIRRLVKNSLRMRPERIIIGEIRDESALDMMTAMTTGHEGSMTTVHANDAEGSISRVANLIAMSGDYPIERALPLIASGLDIIVSIQRYEDGSRRVSTIAEVPEHASMDDNKVSTLVPTILYEFIQDGLDDGKIVGHYEKRNELSDEIIKKHRLDKKESLNLEQLLEISRIDKPVIPE